MFLKSIPLLPAFHIRTTIEFYEKMLGFTALNKGNYAVLTYGNAEIHIYQTDDITAVKNNGCYIQVQNIEDLYANFSLTGVIRAGTILEDKWGGVKEFAINDNNGNLLRFGEKK